MDKIRNEYGNGVIYLDSPRVAILYSSPEGTIRFYTYAEKGGKLLAPAHGYKTQTHCQVILSLVEKLLYMGTVEGLTEAQGLVDGD